MKDTFKKNDRIRDGFTLIELLIVVAIIGILAAIAVPNFMQARTRSQVARVQAELKTMSTTIEQYRLDCNSYPPSPHPLVNPAGVAETWRLTTPVSYISAIPLDPFYMLELDEESQSPTLRGGPFGIDGQYLHYVHDVVLGEYWVTFSYGPDRDLELQQISYDPSNGAVSDGDIYRVGEKR